MYDKPLNHRRCRRIGEARAILQVLPLYRNSMTDIRSLNRSTEISHAYAHISGLFDIYHLHAEQACTLVATSNDKLSNSDLMQYLHGIDQSHMAVMSLLNLLSDAENLISRIGEANAEEAITDACYGVPATASIKLLLASVEVQRMKLKHYAAYRLLSF